MNSPVLSKPGFLGLIFFLGFLFSGCSLRPTVTTWATRPLMDGTMLSIMSETDPQIARSAMESNLKLLEGLIEMKPTDRTLLIMAAQGYTGYTMAFVEHTDPERARSLYERSCRYGLRILALSDKKFLNQDLNFRQFRTLVGKLSDKDIPGAYWTATAWMSRINLDRSSTQSISEMPRALELLKWVHQRDPHYFYSGPLWALGTYYASLPPMLGGDTRKAKAYFDLALEADGNKFLFGKVLYAKYYAVQMLDRELFLTTLREVISGAAQEPPELQLFNLIAQQQAEALIESANDLF